MYRRCRGTERAQNRDHAKTVAEGQGGKDPAFRDAEHGLCSRLARREQARIAEADDDKSTGFGLGVADRAAERPDDGIRVALAFDAGRSFAERHAIDPGPAGDLQRGHRVIDRARDGFGGIRVDHQDAVRHRPIPPAG
jgi:hypothetical protein